MKQYKFKINGRDFDVTIGESEGNTIKVNVNGAEYTVETENAPAAAPKAAPAPAAAAAAPAPQAAPAAAAPAGEGVKVETPMPGVIIEVSVREGQSVKAGDKVAILEAMKMENEIGATKDGVIAAIHVSKGASVNEGDPIVTIR
jgi:biotin carboxyl carrier protein